MLIPGVTSGNPGPYNTTSAQSTWQQVCIPWDWEGCNAEPHPVASACWHSPALSKSMCDPGSHRPLLPHSFQEPCHHLFMLPLETSRGEGVRHLQMASQSTHSYQALDMLILLEEKRGRNQQMM